MCMHVRAGLIEYIWYGIEYLTQSTNHQKQSLVLYTRITSEESLALTVERVFAINHWYVMFMFILLLFKINTDLPYFIPKHNMKYL